MTNGSTGRGSGSRRVLPWIVCCILVGIVATGVGLVLFLIPSPSASFGWFASVPGSATIFSPAGTLLAPVHQAGLIVGAMGMVVVAFGVGWWFGLRQARTWRPQPDTPKSPNRSTAP